MCQGAVFPGPNETVLRRIPVVPGQFNPEKKPPVGKGAFIPNANDTDGLSFFLECETSAYKLIAAAKPGRDYQVARFKISEILGMGLTINLSQGPDDMPGHMIVPEINAIDYQQKATKSALTVHCLELARMANDRIVDFGDSVPVPGGQPSVDKAEAPAERG